MSRYAAPLALIMIGLILEIGGCIFIPSSPKPSMGPDVRNMVGNERSNKPIRIGAITRTELASLLNLQMQNDSRVLTYRWAEKYGQWVGLCYPGWLGDGPERYRDVQIEFQFDDNDRLKNYTIHKVD